MNKIRLYFCFLFILVGGNIYAQFTISGSVTDSSGVPIPNLTLYLQPIDSTIISGYGNTDPTGSYKIEIKNTGAFELITGGIFFEKIQIPVLFKTTSKHFQKNIILSQKVFELEEVVIVREKPILIKKDTIVFDVTSFVRGNEVVVEDLLKSIPGISVDSEGTVKVNGKEVEKIMVDGGDFFEKGYRVLTKNMPSESIEKVELLQNYSENRLLKDIEDDDKIALNLTIKEDSKRIWFGNVQMGYNILDDQFYDAKSNLMNFGNRTKFYFLTNFNNVGYDATGDVNHLVNPYSGDDSSLGDGINAIKILSNNISPLSFNKNRTDFNNAELISLNAIFNPNKSLQIKTLAFLNWDESTFYREQEEKVRIDENFFENNEIYTLKNKKEFFLGKVNFKYDNRGSNIFEGTSIINIGEYSSPSILIFNSNLTKEELNTDNILFDQSLKFTRKFHTGKVLLITSRFKTEKAPQNYSNNQFLFQDLFPSYPEANNVNQFVENKLDLLGFEAHLLDRKTNGNLIELKAGFLNTRNFLNSTFLISEGNQTLDMPAFFQNDLCYNVADIYLKTKYRLELEKFAVIGKLDFHLVYNSLMSIEELIRENILYLKPSIGFNWDFHPDHNITSFYTYNTSNSDILNVYSGFILTDYRSFSRGLGTFNQVNFSNFFLNYKFGDWSDKFVANTSILFNKDLDFFSTNHVIQQEYSLSEKILIRDRNLLSITSNLDRYIDLLKSNFKVELGYSKTNFKNLINDNLREVRSTTWNYGLEFRSGFKNSFNFHLGSKWVNSRIQTTSIFKNKFNLSFADLFLILDNGLEFQFKSERYDFQSEEQKEYYFVDFEGKYKVSQKLSLSVIAKNLTNIANFTSFSISDIGSSTTEYRLLPRHILLKFLYRF
ncbi:MAG: TonB-dependent receptor [Gillisia sp.]